MTDRERIEKGLNICTSAKPCNECPYLTERDCNLSMVYDALELLKEQEAVKPKSESRHGEYPQIVHRCGNCNEILYRYYKYCPTCGRSVKWE